MRTLLGMGVLCGAAFAVQAQNDITLQVDLTVQAELGNWLPGSTNIVVTGGFNNWGTSNSPTWFPNPTLTNNPALSGNASNIYSAVVPMAGAPGSTSPSYKFRMNGGWEDTAIGHDRSFTIVGGAQVIPPVFYEDRPSSVQTNGNVTFSVDMSPQILTGGFVNGGTNQVRVTGRMNGWGAGELMTNNPAAPGAASNIYSATLAVTDTVDNWVRFKFRADGGWESAPVTFPQVKNNDRLYFTQGGDQVLPLYTYNDASICDLLLQPTTVTFRLHITNGTTAINGEVFTNGVTPVNINGQGIFGTWLAWADPVFAPLPQMTNTPPGSDFYEYTAVIPAGRERGVVYKFGIGADMKDNEAGTGADHKQFVRTTGSTFTMPVAEFGTNFAAIRQETAFGSLAVGTPAGGNVPVTWQGLPCVTLQSRTSLSSGAWTDHPNTDGLNSTNVPNSGNQFFRLQKRPQP